MKTTRPSWAYTSVLCNNCRGDRRVVGSFPQPGRLAGVLLKPLQITLDVHFGREPKWLLYIDVGVRFRARTELCARKEDFGLCENRTKTVIPWTIIYVFNVGMIRVYQLKCDSLEMFFVCECNDVPLMYLYVDLSWRWSTWLMEPNEPC